MTSNTKSVLVELLRDGKHVAYFDCFGDMMAWIHQHHCYSFEWACQHEGYSYKVIEKDGN